MQRFGRGFVFILMLGLAFSGLVSPASAQASINETEVRGILSRIDRSLADFRNNLNSDLDQGFVSAQAQTDIDNYGADFKDKFESFNQSFQSRNESVDGLTDLLEAARNVNSSVFQNKLSVKTENSWRGIRGDLDKLASNYGVSWSWAGGGYQKTSTAPAKTSNTSTANRTNPGFTGTYRLDQSRSDKVNEVVEEALTKANTQNREEARQDLEAKLQSPDEIAIELQGKNVTLVSTLSQPITLATDGSLRNETLPDGSALKIRSLIRGQELTVSSIGTNSDYTVTFTLLDNQTLKVSRRVTTDYLNQTVFVESFYSKTEQYARMDVYGNSGNSNTTAQNQPQTQQQQTQTGNSPQPSITYGRTGQYVVPSGTIITGTLNNDISSKVSQNNDRFRMTVQAPAQFRGAIIEGYISGIRNRSGKVTGRSQITFNFETIRMTNGETYDFAGFLQSVTDLNGETIKVDTEGNAKGGSQTKESIKRGGIGAGLGAIIGGIIGGGKGAIIGATIGGGAGAGSVILQKEGELDLKAGSSLSVQSSSPKGN